MRAYIVHSHCSMRWWRTSVCAVLHGISFSSWSISIFDWCWGEPISHHNSPFQLLCSWYTLLVCFLYFSFKGKIMWDFLVVCRLARKHFCALGVWNSEVFNGSTNITLQAVARIIVESLNDLSDHGLPVPGVGDTPATCLKLSGYEPPSGVKKANIKAS